MLEEQALLLWYELHLHRVSGQKFAQRLGYCQHVFLRRLHPQSTQVLWFPELRFWKLCQANSSHQSLFNCTLAP